MSEEWLREDEPITCAVDRARILVEALPWIKDVTGQTIVIKYGGAAMRNAELRSAVMSDILIMRLVGMNPIIVHGGGPAITSYLERLSIPSEFRDGLRVTTPEVMEVVSMVLLGKVNRELVSAFNEHGPLAVGMTGVDSSAVQARIVSEELGRVGEVTSVDTSLYDTLIAQNFIPVIASIARGEDGSPLNVNADSFAAAIAAAVDAHKLIFMTDVDGLYRDFEDKSSLISRLSEADARELIGSETMSTGMIPKLEAAVTALEAGVSHAHILNGTTPHSLILELLTDEGIGTMITGGGVRPEKSVTLRRDSLAALQRKW